MNEVMTLAAKAARGAGSPPAQAGQFGRAAIAHLAAGRPVIDLTAALRQLPGGPILMLPLVLVRIGEGAVNGAATATLPPEFGALAHSYVDALPFETLVRDDGRATFNFDTPSPRRPAVRIDLPEDAYAEWADFAARLLVPESEASRAGGAGAGLSDND